MIRFPITRKRLAADSSDRLRGRSHRPSLYALRPNVFLLAIGLIAVLTAPLRAALPQLTRVTPPGVQRGTEVEVQLEGARLADAQGLLLYYPGVEVKGFDVKDGRPKARLAIAPDCRLGPHAVRLRTASGVSNLVTFSVGAFPLANELEPNNDFDKPQKTDLNTTVQGVIQNEDVDYFLVEAKKGERLAVEIEGFRLGETTFDPFVAILDRKRFVLASTDDTPLAWQDAALSIVVPEDGAYVIQVRESSFGGSAQCRYLMHVGRFPRPQAVYPAGGKLGQPVDVRWLGDAQGEWAEKTTLPAAQQPMFGLPARDAQGVAPSPNPFRLSTLDNLLESEPNNAPAEATPFEAPIALNGVIDKPGDVDSFKFTAKKGQGYDLRVFARSLRSPLDAVLSIHRPDGGTLAANDDSTTPDSYLRFAAPADGPYVITLRDHLNQGNPTYVYRIEVATVEPRLLVSLPEQTAFVDVTAPVPRGNRMAFMVNAQREDCGGEVKLDLTNLPGGMKAELMPIASDRSMVPVLLTAATDAPLTGSLAGLVGRTTEGDRVVEGRLEQRTSMIRGQNNREVWNHYTDRMAVAVTERVPFRIEVVESKVPVVQSGSLGLKVVATREGDFKAPITLRMLYHPPGISAPDSVPIPEGQREAVIPLTADAKAAVGTWKIAVIGEATVGDGPVRVSSQLAKLDVTEPFVAFTFPMLAVEQGQSTSLVVKVDKRKDYEGTASVDLLGLPNEVTSQTQQVTKDTAELTFPIQTTAKSPPGLHKGLLCRMVILASGEPITHMLGPGELRIQPPVAKPTSVAASPTKQEPAKPAAKAKPLSQLEQLRQQRQKTK
jgi:hypothetical protein